MKPLLWSYQLIEEIDQHVSDENTKNMLLEDLDLWLKLRSNYLGTKRKSPSKPKSTRKPLDQSTKDKLSKALINRPKPFNYKQVVYDGVLYPSIKHCLMVTKLPRTTLWRHLISSKHPECYYV